MKILIAIIKILIEAFMFTKIIDLRGKVVTAWVDVTQAAIGSFGVTRGDSLGEQVKQNRLVVMQCRRQGVREKASKKGCVLQELF